MVKQANRAQRRFVGEKNMATGGMKISADNDEVVLDIVNDAKIVPKTDVKSRTGPRQKASDQRDITEGRRSPPHSANHFSHFLTYLSSN